MKDDAGTYHLFYSRWKKEHGFGAWVTCSEIARATSKDLFGRFTPQGVVLPERGVQFWDGHCTYNPTIRKWDGKYYLYYTGNFGDRKRTKGLNWSHRNNQRIGVAVALQGAENHVLSCFDIIFGMERVTDTCSFARVREDAFACLGKTDELYPIVLSSAGALSFTACRWRCENKCVV